MIHVLAAACQLIMMLCKAPYDIARQAMARFMHWKLTMDIGSICTATHRKCFACSNEL